MGSARLMKRIQDYLSGQGIRDGPDKISQIADFIRLTLRALRLVEPSDRERLALVAAISARTGYRDEQSDRILSMELSPEFGGAVSDFELRVFGNRFGPSAVSVLQSETADELDLAGFSRTHGGDAAILLLDTLFSVVAADGLVHDKE
ncbi:MAG: hypothetical protein ACI8S6_001904, partial [Myxococcota bacterium]